MAEDQQRGLYAVRGLQVAHQRGSQVVGDREPPPLLVAFQVRLSRYVPNLAVGLRDVSGGAARIAEARASGGRIVSVIDDRPLNVGSVAA